jgi:hypothetical protein
LVKNPFIGRTTCFGPLLGHHQVTKNILRGNYGGGRVTVRVILRRDLVVTFVAKISRVITKHLIRFSTLMGRCLVITLEILATNLTTRSRC